MSDGLDASASTPPSHGIASGPTPGATRGVRTTADSIAEGRMIVGVTGHKKKRKILKDSINKIKRINKK